MWIRDYPNPTPCDILKQALRIESCLQGLASRNRSLSQGRLLAAILPPLVPGITTLLEWG